MSQSIGAVPSETVDAVVIGAGHHGLVAATTLADAGWDVVVLEGRAKPGGAVSSVERDGWVLDEFSACHPLAAVSPVIVALDLAGYGLRWSRCDAVVTHSGRPDDTQGSTIYLDPARTAQWLSEDHPADGPAWLALVSQWRQVKAPLLASLLTRWPPIAPAARVAAALGARALPDFVRFLLLPVTRMAQELFQGQRARMLLAGNAMHADIPPEAPGSGVFGWIMTMLAQDVGFPSPVGGSRRLAEALAARAEAAGARIDVGEPVARIAVRGDTAYGVVTRSGRTIRARRAVIADTSAPALFGHLLPPGAVPSGLRDDLGHFEWDLPTLKLNYRMRGTAPWTAEQARSAGVVHVGADLDGIIDWSADLATRRVPQHPFALVGQMTNIDPTRSPAGTQAMWLYSHLPRGVTDDASADRLVDNLERMLDRFAPGWHDQVIDRWVQRPSELARADANLGMGAVGGGTSQLYQQLVFRPVTGLGGPRTHLGSLYLGSAAIHPGGGVHGACGYLAARCALADSRWWGMPRRRLELAALHHLYSRPG